MKSGEMDRSTLNAMNNLGSVYNQQGKYSEGEILLKRCLDKRKIVLGENHPDTLSTMSNLASAYQYQVLDCS